MTTRFKDRVRKPKPISARRQNSQATTTHYLYITRAILENTVGISPATRGKLATELPERLGVTVRWALSASDGTIFRLGFPTFAEAVQARLAIANLRSSFGEAMIEGFEWCVDRSTQLGLPDLSMKMESVRQRYLSAEYDFAALMAWKPICEHK